MDKELGRIQIPTVLMGPALLLLGLISVSAAHLLGFWSQFPAELEFAFGISGGAEVASNFATALTFSLVIAKAASLLINVFCYMGSFCYFKFYYAPSKGKTIHDKGIAALWRQMLRRLLGRSRIYDIISYFFPVHVRAADNLCFVSSFF